MSQHMAFRRQPVPQQVAQQHKAITLPAPNRGMVDNENYSFMQPGGAIIYDNWIPTMRGAKLRGGHTRWCDLHALDTPVPPIDAYERLPVLSAFEYASGNVQKMFAANQTKLYDVTTTTPVLVKDSQLSGNYAASQMANASGNHMLVVNDAGDFPLHYDGVTWTTFNASQITTNPIVTPPPSCAAGHNLTYVCKYRNRFFFVEGGTMNAWYLPIDSFQGQLNLVPLAGAATRGGKLLFCASWSIDAGDGIDDKIVFCTDLGELLIFTGSNPADAANWRQEGRYQVPAPMGMNAHTQLGGDLLIATVDGIVPVSSAITKDAEQLDLSMITRSIRAMWRSEANAKRQWNWTLKRWDEYGGMFATWPGGAPGHKYCAVVNTGTGAWARFTGWDAMCFVRMRGDMFFGTQNGLIMQADRTGYDDGVPYVASILGGWGMFGGQAQTKTWSQARASFSANNDQPFVPQIASCIDFVIDMPTPPPAGPDPGVLDVWDQGKWGPGLGNYVFPMWDNNVAYPTAGAVIYDTIEHSYWAVAIGHTSAVTGSFAADRAARPTFWTFVTPQPGPPIPTTPEREAYAQWDQPSQAVAPVRNTGWVSIGSTGYSHAPVIQVTVAQQAKPDVELISIDALYWAVGTDV